MASSSHQQQTTRSFNTSEIPFRIQSPSNGSRSDYLPSETSSRATTTSPSYTQTLIAKPRRSLPMC